MTTRYAELWLIVLKAGGWVTLSEIIDELPGMQDRDRVSQDLWCMVNRSGFLCSRGSREKREWAVTPECMIPQYLPLGKIMEALK
jgi:hypothetical protein